MNITHITNLWRAYFIENNKKLLFCCLIVFGIMTYGFTVNAMPEISPLIPYLILFWIAGTFFQHSLKNNNRNFSFNLPVTSCEKFVTSIIILLTLTVVFKILIIAGAYTGHSLINSVFDIAKPFRWELNGRPDVWSQIILPWDGYLAIAAALSVFLFGSIYFKKNAFIKTMASGIGFIFICGLYKFALGRTYIALLQYRTYSNFSLSDYINVNHYSMFFAISILLFLSLTCLRLKETEV